MARVLGVLRGARRAAAAGARAHPRVALPRPLPVSGRARLRALAAARAATGTGSTRASDRWTTLGSRLRARARSSMSSLGSLGSADVGLMNRLVAALAETPHRYVVSQGPAARADRARAEHDWRRVPAAAGDPAARRPRDHSRRQQHGHRGRPLRQADDRAPLVLGSVRQCPARGGMRLRRAPSDLRVRGPRAARRDRSATRRGAAAAPRGVGSPAGEPRDGRGSRPDPGARPQAVRPASAAPGSGRRARESRRPGRP